MYIYIYKYKLNINSLSPYLPPKKCGAKGTLKAGLCDSPDFALSRHDSRSLINLITAIYYIVVSILFSIIPV